MFLEDWLKIKKIGKGKFAKMLGIERTTLFYWLKGKKKPNSINMSKIKRLTNGKVTYEEISKYDN